MIKETCQKIYYNQYFPFIILVLIMIPVHFFMGFGADDLWFQEFGKTAPLLSILKTRYFTWTSRIVIEAVLFSVVQVDVLLWRLLNIFFITLLVISISKLTDSKTSRTENMLITLLFLVYPLIQVSSAGWAATTINYVWTVSAGLFALIPFLKIIRQQSLKFYEYPLYLLALIFAANQEQVCLLLISFGLIFTAYYMITTKHLNWYLFIWNTISILSLTVMLLSPGNANRTIQETQTWFPGFDQYSIAYKAYIGISNTLNYLFNSRNNLVLLLSFLLFYIVFKYHKKVIYRVLTGIPLVFTMIARTPYMAPFFNQLNSPGTANSLSGLLPAMIILVVLGLMMFAIYLIYKTSLRSIFLIILLCSSLMSGFILGASPTVYASGQRIFFPLNMIMLLLIALLYHNEKNSFSLKETKLFGGLLVVIAGINCYNFLPPYHLHDFSNKSML